MTAPFWEGDRVDNNIYVIGIGPDGRGSLSVQTETIIKEAQLLIGSQRFLALFPEVSAEKLALRTNLAEVIEMIREASLQKRVVILASGDPGCFGIARRLIEVMGKDRVEIIPSISSVQLAFARIKENWDDAVLVSVHGRSIEGIIDTIRRNRKIAVFTDQKNTAQKIAEILEEHGINNCQAYVCENLGMDSERVTQTDLNSLKTTTFSDPNILILIREPADAAPPPVAFGLPEDAFRHREVKKGQITKQEIRAISLAKLQLVEDSTVWDIGAGSGAISIDAARLAHRGHVFSIEKDAQGIEIAGENIRRFAISNIELIETDVPNGINNLPDPDAVFIGGTGGRLREILDAICLRIKPGGRLVMNLVVLENMAQASELLAQRGFDVETTSVNIARSAKIAGLTRLEPLTPVFIISAIKC